MPKITYLDDDNHIVEVKRTKGRKGLLVVSFLILSFLMGSAGGVFGLLAVSSSSNIKEKLGINLQDLNINTNKTEKLILEESSAFIEVTKKVSPAVVSISASKNVEDFFGQVVQEQGGGTGFIITNDGLILTNKHVAQAGDSLQVIMSDGKKFDAKTVAVDPTNDLAILKIEASGLPAVELGDSDDLQIGQFVLAVGNALGELQNTVTLGVISAKERQLTAGGGSQTEQLNNLLQTDAAINPGNSGGPLVNLKGQVIGINTAIAGNAQNIGFAIPINQVKAAIESYKKTGKIIKPALGVRYVALTKEIAKRLELTVETGALIISRAGQPAVVAQSAADKAGLKANDIIMQINNTKIDENHTLSGIISQFLPGEEVEIKYIRDKKENTLKLKLGSTE